MEDFIIEKQQQQQQQKVQRVFQISNFLIKILINGAS